jgi:hypothetical protein
MYCLFDSLFLFLFYFFSPSKAIALVFTVEILRTCAYFVILNNNCVTVYVSYCCFLPLIDHVQMVDS